jgi:hypothetical protein
MPLVKRDHIFVPRHVRKAFKANATDYSCHTCHSRVLQADLIMHYRGHIQDVQTIEDIQDQIEELRRWVQMPDGTGNPSSDTPDTRRDETSAVHIQGKTANA